MARPKIKVFFSKRAERDLAEIYRYLSEHSLNALETVDKALFKAFHRLEDFPQSGHWVRELSGKRYREVLVFHFRVIYRYQAERKKLMIMTIRHGSRFLPKLSTILL